LEIPLGGEKNPQALNFLLWEKIKDKGFINGEKLKGQIKKPPNSSKREKARQAKSNGRKLKEKG